MSNKHTSKIKFLEDRGYKVFDFVTDDTVKVNNKLSTITKTTKVATKDGYVPDDFADASMSKVISEIGIDVVYKNENTQDK